MQSKKAKTDDKVDAVLERLKKSRARSVQLPAGEHASRLDVMKAIASNRAITTLDLDDVQVRWILQRPFLRLGLLIITPIKCV